MAGERYCTYDGGELLFRQFLGSIRVFICRKCRQVFFAETAEHRAKMGVADSSECEKAKREKLEKDLEQSIGKTQTMAREHELLKKRVNELEEKLGDEDFRRMGGVSFPPPENQGT
ncbi:MAG: hypothetical protein ABR875_02300 [Minisyncoccia bacterium]